MIEPGGSAFDSTATDHAQIIRGELKSGESLVWSGQPRGGLRLRPSDAGLIPFSIMWGGFSLVWEGMALYAAFGSDNTLHGPDGIMRFLFPLWGLPFVGVGLYMLVGRFFYDAWRRSKTYYGVTDQRVLICSRVRGHNVQSINLKTLPVLTLDQKGDGSGTIGFGQPNIAPNAGGNAAPFNSQRSSVPEFEMIENVREVYNMIQTAQQDVH